MFFRNPVFSLSLVCLVLSACGQNEVDLDMAMSNKKAEEAFLASEGDPERLLQVFKSVSDRPSTDFYWGRWWHFLTEQTNSLPFSPNDSKAWDQVFASSRHFCPNPTEPVLMSFIEFMQGLRAKSKVWPRSKALYPLVECKPRMETSRAEQLFRAELDWEQQEEIDFVLLNFYIDSVSSEFLNSLEDGEWQAIAAAWRAKSNAEDRSTQAAASEELMLKWLERSWTTEHTLYQLRSSFNLSSGPVGVHTPSNFVAAKVESRSLEVSKDFPQAIEYWRLASKLFLLALTDGEISSERLLHEHQLMLEYLGLKATPQEDVLLGLLRVFDEIADKLYLTLQGDAAIRENFKNLLLKNSGRTSFFEAWIWTLLEGTYSHDIITPVGNLSGPLAKVQELVSNRITLRNDMAYDILDLIHPEPHSSETMWWGLESHCPILFPDPDNPNSLRHLEWEFIDNRQYEIGEGCYRLEDGVDNELPYKIKATYDTLIYAPGLKQNLTSISCAILDVSGSTPESVLPDELDRDFEDGRGFPVILVNERSREWLLFHFVSVAPESPTYNDSSVLVTSDGGDAGEISVNKSVEFPAWIRAYSGLPGPLLEKVQGGKSLRFSRTGGTEEYSRWFLKRAGIETYRQIRGHDLLRNVKEHDFLERLEAGDWRLLDPVLQREFIESLVSNDYRDDQGFPVLSRDLFNEFLQKHPADWKTKIFEQLAEVLTDPKNWNNPQWLASVFDTSSTIGAVQLQSEPLVFLPGERGSSGRFHGPSNVFFFKDNR